MPILSLSAIEIITAETTVLPLLPAYRLQESQVAEKAFLGPIGYVPEMQKELASLLEVGLECGEVEGYLCVVRSIAKLHIS